MMKLSVLIFVTSQLFQINAEECYHSVDSGRSYSGQNSFTKSGVECVPWGSFNLHSNVTQKNMTGNFCRNPTNASSPWCYTNINGKVWEYCAIPECQVKCSTDEITCADGSGCILESHFCDGIKHCKDGSDESGFPVMGVNGIMCKSLHSKNPKACFLREENCCRGTKTALCQDGLDKCFCEKGKNQTLASGFFSERCFRCFSAPHVMMMMHNLCDGVIDCPDLTDEVFCDHYDRVPILMSMKSCDASPPTFSCQAVESDKDEEIELNLDQICDRTQDCKYNIDEQNCQYHAEVTNYTCQFENKEVSACDGIPQCASDMYEEECKCINNPSFCQYVKRNLSTNQSFFACPITQRTVPGNRVCDGVPDCPSSEDELHCPKRFYCLSGRVLHIPDERKCDVVKDCLDGSDESKETCGDKLFFCDDGGYQESLFKEGVCNGVASCTSGVDECQPQCINSVFSDVNSLVKDKSILRLIWVICACAVLGNIAVACRNVWKILTCKTADDRMKVNRALILSLSLSDLCVGIYIAIICVASMLSEGKYCLEDPSWRSGSTCEAIGILLTTGSEQSVFNMVLITISRIEITFRPLRRPRKRLYFFLILLTWTTSIIVAILPTLNSRVDYFLREIWVGGDNYYAFMTKRSQLDCDIAWLLLSQNDSSPSELMNVGKWSLYSKLVLRVMPDLSKPRLFGYYSRHAVCLPNLFSDDKDRSWGYSLILVLINLLAFLFMLVGYIAIYKKATEKNIARPRSVQKKTSGRLQTKLTRILVTDFCCWIPVCTLCLLQLSGVRIADDMYLPVGLIIIPINSALNPFLYTDIPELMWNKVVLVIQYLRDRFCQEAKCFPSKRDNDAHTGNTGESNA